MKKGIGCVCGKIAEPKKNLSFNGYKLDGWKCSCGEIYYEPEQAQRILLINKLRKAKIKVKLGRIKSNLILRIPKDIEKAIGLNKGDKLEIQLKDDKILLSSVD